MRNLFTNSTHRRDFLYSHFAGLVGTPCQIFAAVAFFTDHEQLVQLSDAGCRVDLVVRLGFPTSPNALAHVRGKEGVRVRFVSDSSFHPKLYIFDEHGVVVGSSNLTKAALMTNQEVNVVLGVDDERYAELRTLFQEYWDDAKPLDDSSLELYRRAYNTYASAFARTSQEMEARVTREIGRVTVNNIDRGVPKAGARVIELDGYRKTYQEFEACFRTVKRVYEQLGRRRYSEAQLPLRIEIDQFLSFVREEKAKGDAYLHAPRLAGPALEAKIREAALEFLAAHRAYSDNTVVPVSYPELSRVLGTPASISIADYEDVISALSCIHSFYDRLRFFPGGHATHVEQFKSENELQRVRATLTYLLHGKADYCTRMGNCIFSPEYVLRGFGRSAVQETLGWVNKEDVPICNSRTLKAMHWLGLKVKMIEDGHP